MRLDEPGALDNCAHRAHGGIEALQVTDLQDLPVPGRGPDKTVGFLEGISDRLLHQNVDTFIQKLLSDLAVKRGRSRDTYGVHLAEELPVIGVAHRLQRQGDLFCTAWDLVRNSDELCLRQGGIHASVMVAQRAHTYDSNPHLVHRRQPFGPPRNQE